MNNFFILHGTDGSPYGNWFGWLHNEICQAGGRSYVPMMPTLYKQSYSNWAKILKAYLDIGLIDENTTFICHSSAPIFLIKFVLKYKIKIKKVVFVAGSNGFKCGFAAIDEANESFFLDDVSDFKNYCPKRICLYAENDKYISLADLKRFAYEIEAEHVLMKGKGHMNAEVGIIEFPEILKYL